ncbi:universal stress protein [Streptomyces sp. NPDC089424]|uniref:universal stress protein n=1 Tax=Streptomyces sp. NPDC089424 TaxID=3365917 RepID=UPI0038165BAF
MTGPVVVGVDGSPAGLKAVWWAAHEAVDRHAPLHLLHSWTTQPLVVPAAQEADGRREHGRDVLERTAAELLDHHGDLLELTTETVSAPAEQALLDRSGDAGLLVLGSRGHSSVAGFLLGSVTLQVVSLALCPAVVVRADDPTVETSYGRLQVADRDEIVVGVPESGPAVDAVLEFAFTTADANGGLVRAVTAVPPSSPAHSVEEERTQLAAMLAPWQGKFPDVPVVARVGAGPAGQILLASCARSRLLIVGRRPRPTHLVWKLRPVTQAAVRHAACPVAVVPHC